MYECGIGPNIFLVTVISVDEYEQVPGSYPYLCPFIVACRCTHTTFGITVDGQTFDIDHSATYTFVRFIFFPYAKRECVADKFIRVESSDTVTISNTCQIDHVHKRVYLVERLSLKYSSDQRFRCRAVARRIFAACPVDASGGSYS